MFPIVAQARFPKPEFTQGYEYPQMGLEESVFADDWVKLAVYAAMLAFAGAAMYRFRSRRLLLLLSLFSAAVLGFYWRGCPCPIGLTQNAAAYACDANAYYPFVYFAVFALPILAALFFGRIFCGGVCPLGAIQEIVLLKPIRLPAALDMLLRLVPFAVLVFALVFAAAGGPYFVCRLDPFVPLFRGAAPLYMAVASGLVIALSVFVSRPYCRYFCPYGVLLKFASHLSMREVKIAPRDCVNCRLCEGACPNGAIVAPETGRIFESAEKSKARIGRIIALTPLFALAAALAGFAFGDFVAQLHPTPALLSMVEAGLVNEDTDAFYSSGVSLGDLKALAAGAVWKIRVGFALGGVFLALAASFEAVRTSRRAQNRTYVADMGACLCCGRCYNACPDEIARRKGMVK